MNGKYELQKYSDLLDNADVENYIIADRDYITDLDTTEIDDLFTEDNNKVRDSLRGEEQERLTEAITELEEEKIYILPKGDLETYLPHDEKDIHKAIELTKDDEFERWLASSRTGPDWLLEIAQDITASN